MLQNEPRCRHDGYEIFVLKCSAPTFITLRLRMSPVWSPVSSRGERFGTFFIRAAICPGSVL